jgi:hypothetical protein
MRFAPLAPNHQQFFSLPAAIEPLGNNFSQQLPSLSLSASPFLARWCTFFHVRHLVLCKTNVLVHCDLIEENFSYLLQTLPRAGLEAQVFCIWVVPKEREKKMSGVCVCACVGGNKPV